MPDVNNDFTFFVPMDISKSESSSGEMRIRGFASTSDKDRQDDQIIQKGLDITDFVNFGWFNYDHDNTKILGYPDKLKTEIRPQGFYVEGLLLPAVPLAKSLWDIAVDLVKSNAPRRLGFSVEGKTLARDKDGRIIKAKVYNVAITPNPVNPNATWDALVKSFSTDENFDKSMEAGYTSPIGEINTGACLKPESLESAFKVLAKALGGDEEASKSLNGLKDKLGLSKSLDADELVLYFQLTKGLSRVDSLDLINKLVKYEED